MPNKNLSQKFIIFGTTELVQLIKQASVKIKKTENVKTLTVGHPCQHPHCGDRGAHLRHGRRGSSSCSHAGPPPFAAARIRSSPSPLLSLSPSLPRGTLTLAAPRHARDLAERRRHIADDRSFPRASRARHRPRLVVLVLLLRAIGAGSTGSRPPSSSSPALPPPSTSNRRRLRHLPTSPSTPADSG